MSIVVRMHHTGRRRSQEAAALSLRKDQPRLLRSRSEGIFIAPFETGEIGPDLFRHACLMGLEGMVSKHRESTYRSRRFRQWIKVKNRQHPAFRRVQDQF